MVLEGVIEIHLYATAPNLSGAELLHIEGTEKCRIFLQDFLTEVPDKESPELEAKLTYEDGREVFITK